MDMNNKNARMLNRNTVYRPVMYKCFANITEDKFSLVEH